ncbi:RloB family protein [Armatimonas sp.]|uniref:RloB family protein n=1 Tax=Armatimonas sp. TaxID=1872638 RepID=UPI0037506D35
MSDGLDLLERKVGTRDPKLFVVAIEGDKTERRYLEPLRKRYGVEMTILPPQGHSSPQAVLKKLKDYQASEDWMLGDELWLMVDVDKWHRLPEVCHEAKTAGYEIAISNPRFELWLWLHLFDYDAEKLPTLKSALSEATKGYYFNDPQQWQEYVSEAIRRAKELPGTHLEPVPGVPGTTVYRLMERVVNNKNQNRN